VPGFFVENFGCRATQADGAALERQFQDQGLVRASTPIDASVVVLNTCTVTSGADQDARAAIRRVRKQNPEAKIIVTGCYAQRAPEEIAALPGVSLVVGNSHKHQLAEIAVSLEQVSSDSRLRNSAQPSSGTASSGWRTSEWRSSGWRSASSAAKDSAGHEGALAPEVHGFIPLASLSTPASEAESRIFVSDIFAHTELLAAPVFDAANERTRPNLKIQDGCDNRCSFCVIPYVRGQSRSLEMDRIIGEVNTLVESGYHEVVLSGINLGRWGRDLQNARIRNRRATLENLISVILDETRLEKLRISSVEPMDWSDELIELVATSPRITKHAHVPMQSGSDAVLRRMHRKYRPWHYREKIEKIHAAMPQAAIGADVMVGFPGETDSEFEKTRQMIEELPFTYLHVFTYSARPGTPAATMPTQVPVQIARERNRRLREVASEKKLAFMRSFIGKSLEAITLNVIGNDADGEFTEALTDNYLKLRLRGRHEPNRWLHASVSSVTDGVLQGE
jgi:threonylcarbamoyladenosine tRNA methylthiotransferase MtaB